MLRYFPPKVKEFDGWSTMAHYVRWVVDNGTLRSMGGQQWRITFDGWSTMTHHVRRVVDNGASRSTGGQQWRIMFDRWTTMAHHV